MNIAELIVDFKRNNSMLWVETDTIRLFVSDEFDESDTVIEQIKKYKPDILDCLVSNGIFSKEDFQKKTIFRLNCNESVLSFAQTRLWFIELYEGGANTY